MLGDALGDEDAVKRRFFDWHWVPDSNTGQKRLSSAAFELRDKEEYLSGYARSLLQDNDLATRDVLIDHRDMGVAGIPVDTLRAYEYDAAADPDGVDPEKPHPCDVAHSAIVVPALTKSGLKKRAGKLAKDDAVQILIPPPESGNI